MLLAHESAAEVWTFHAHPDVWLMVILLSAGYIAALRYLGPQRAPAGEPVATAKQKAFFFAGVAMLWIGADWPIHELGEDYLFSAHMVQHTLFSLVAPPLLLIGMPRWLLRALVGGPRAIKVAKVVTRPLVGLLLFNVVIVVTHWPALVDLSLTSELVHFVLHSVLFVSATIMWWPVVDPLPELSRLSPPGKMLYLFLQSIVPTVPASFLTFADGVIYEFYATVPRLWGIDVVTDQRVAGLIMKIGGGLLLWLAIAYLFFKWNAAEERQDVDEVSWEDFEHELQVWELRRG
ncbi:MAG TPA: cytochrome c oxidase assembly protein [Actinomycetota bacterium]|nr:cytochrome c oxidase assembly protein [Actinomycetota bacterium]